MNKVIRLCAVALALCLSLATVPTTVAPAQAAGPYCEFHHVTKHASNGAGHYRVTLWGKGCLRPHVGHDIMWFKPTNGLASYHTTHYVFHPTLYCPPAGDLTYYVFRLYVWNPTTGYNHHIAIHVDCQNDGSNSVVKGLVHWPRCYMPWVIDSEGRGGQTGHRSHCYLRANVERVYFAYDPNGHDNIVNKVMIHAFANVNR